MAKAMLIIDMPESCIKCNLSTYQIGGVICKYNQKMYKYNGNKPDWCPLREVPEKKSDRRCQDEYYMNGYKDGYKDGYNACIDEILKDKTGA